MLEGCNNCLQDEEENFDSRTSLFQSGRMMKNDKILWNFQEIILYNFQEY